MKSFIILSPYLLSASTSHAQNISVQQMASADSAMNRNVEAAINTLHLDTLKGKIVGVVTMMLRT